MGKAGLEDIVATNLISVIPEDFLLQLKMTNYTMAKSAQRQGCQTILTMALVSFFLYPSSFHLSPCSFTDREVTSEESIYWILTPSLPAAYSPQWMLLLSVLLNSHALCTGVATGSLAQKWPWVGLKLNRSINPTTFDLFTHLWVTMYTSCLQERATITF